jgi:hypothetical protein
MLGNQRYAKTEDRLEFLSRPARGSAMRIQWPLVRQILLTLFSIYFIGGAIMFTVQLLQAFDLATPFTVGGAAILVAAIARLIIRKDL